METVESWSGQAGPLKNVFGFHEGHEGTAIIADACEQHGEKS